MFRLLGALLGMAVILAIFAGIYYAPENEQARTIGHPAFNLSPGEVRQESFQPTLPGSFIVVTVEVLSGTVDLYVMDKEWTAPLAGDGRIALDVPFSFHAGPSQTFVNGSHSFSLLSDGMTWQTLLIDNSDNYYDNDAGPHNQTASVLLTYSFVDEEQRSLTLGYIAAAPSILLVVVTLGRQIVRRRRQRL